MHVTERFKDIVFLALTRERTTKNQVLRNGITKGNPPEVQSFSEESYPSEDRQEFLLEDSCHNISGRDASQALPPKRMPDTPHYPTTPRQRPQNSPRPSWSVSYE